MVNEDAINKIVERISETLNTIESSRREEFLKDIEQELLETNNLELFYKLCKEIDEIDKIPYINAVIKSKDPEYSYKFSGIYDGKLLLQFSDIIIESKNPEYNYRFFEKYLWNCTTHLYPPVSWAVYAKRKKAHLGVVLESKDPKYNYLCARNCEDLDIKPKEHLKALIESKDPKYNFLAASQIRNIDIEPHENVVIESGNVEYNYKFVNDVARAKITEHKRVILEAQSRNYLSDEDKIYIEAFIETYGSDDYSIATEKVKKLIKDLDIKKLNQNNETV